MSAFQTLNEINQSLGNEFSILVDGRQQSTLWMGNTEETPITGIKIHETETKFILKVSIPNLHLIKNFSLQITPEKVLIQGQPTDSMVVEGYFRPHGFQSLIPLPQAVQPETCFAKIQPYGLILEVTKEVKVQPSKIWIQLPN